MSARDIKTSLPAWLGELVHQAIELTLKNKKHGIFTHKPMLPVKAHLRKCFKNFQAKYNIPANKNYKFDGWTEKEMTRWVFACVRTFTRLLEEEQISWFQEEWALDYISPPENCCCAKKSLGRVDFFGYSEKRRCYILIELKTEYPDGKQHILPNGRIHAELWGKLLKYAGGVAQRALVDENRKVRTIDAGVLVFMRKKVCSGQEASFKMATHRIQKRKIHKMIAAFFPQISNLPPI